MSPNSPELEEILHNLEKRLSNTLNKYNNGMPIGAKHFGDAFLEAKSKIQELITKHTVEELKGATYSSDPEYLFRRIKALSQEGK